MEGLTTLLSTNFYFKKKSNLPQNPAKKQKNKTRTKCFHGLCSPWVRRVGHDLTTFTLLLLADTLIYVPSPE